MIIAQASVSIYTYIMLTFIAGQKSMGLATDPFENKLYYTELIEQTVNMVKLETGEKTTIVKKTKGRPYSVILDRKAR